MGTYFTPTVDRYSLTVDVTEALRHGVSSLCTDATRAEQLLEAVSAARCAKGRHPDAGAVIGPVNGALTPDMFASGEELPEGYVWVRTTQLHRLWEDLGAKVESVWYDGNSEHYGSNNRSVEIVSIREGFRLWTVRIAGWGTPPTKYGVGPATDVVVAPETYVVHPGEYLVGEKTSDYAACTLPDVVAYLGPEGEEDNVWNFSTRDRSEQVFYALAESEGWDASHAYAECDTCGARWDADGGSWKFTPAEDSDAVSFDYDDTVGHDGSSVQCPWCSTDHDDRDGEPTGPGRVFFDFI